MVMRIMESGQGYNLRIGGAIEVRTPWALLAFWFTVSMIIKIDQFLWFIMAAEFTPKATMSNAAIFMPH